MCRKNGERLHQECSTKDMKEGTGGRMAKFVVVISHGRDVIEYFWYDGNINGVLFSQFVRERFPHIFSKGIFERKAVPARWRPVPKLQVVPGSYG